MMELGNGKDDIPFFEMENNPVMFETTNQINQITSHFYFWPYLGGNSHITVWFLSGK